VNVVLHALRCMGFTGTNRVATATGLPESTVESDLIDLAIAGLVRHTPGIFGGWGLTEAGRAADAAHLASEVDGVRDAVVKCYDDFLVLNPELLDICAAWQTKPGGVVLSVLTDFHTRADAVLADLSVALARFGRYRERLTTALERASTGETGYVTNDVESYHAVWFQLHEDLLATLGIPR
jgi:DNA-binding IscR family transcriptional regulator